MNSAPIEPGRSEPIAIVGIGCRLPGGNTDPRKFWGFLSQRGDAIGDVPADRWDAAALFAEDPAAPGRTYARRGGFLRDIDQFDADFFGISPREAAHIDPQQRLLLETAHEAMEDAGEVWSDPQVRDTGVFVGIFIHDYQHIQFADRELLSAHTGTGSAMSIAANRISYVFDLHGPSMAVDTACSSSLVAVDLACKALRAGDCRYALAGGANVILKPEMTIAMSKATMLSKDGYCRSFDQRANGYVRAEGAGLVVLRRLSDAIAAGNPIYAIIRGSGVNCDGQTKGISVPSAVAQEALIRRVLAEARIEARSVSYVEAHGTGTPVGDPIEASALGRVFADGRGPGEVCHLGSVKSNIGHLESASGVAGLIKVALCLRHGQIPANLHFSKPNPAIDFDALKLRVVTEQLPWPRTGVPRRAVINSFGFGGTNAHVLLEEAPVVPARPRADGPASSPRWVMPWGAHDAAALRARAAGIAQAFDADLANGKDVLYTVAQRRSHGRFRAALVARSAEDLRDQLLAFAAGQNPPGATSGEVSDGFSGRPVFVFSGMGSQSWAMGRELLESDAVFRAEVERVASELEPLTGWSVVDRLLASPSESEIDQTQVAQCAIFAIQAGLVARWRAWGVEPAAVVGHSVGEAAALYTAGVLTLQDAVNVIYQRSRLQAKLAGQGGMLAVGTDAAAATRLIRGFEQQVSIAAVNSPTSLTLSGHSDVLLELERRLGTEGVFARRLQVEVPYHGPKMDLIRAELLEGLKGLRPSVGECAYFSTTDRSESPTALGGAEYWWRNVRQPVQFAAAIDAALAAKHTVFVEVGAHPVLRTPIEECLKARGVQGTVLASLQRKHSDHDVLASSLGALHVAGANIAWARLSGPGEVVAMEPYPWQRTRHWFESAAAEGYRKGLTRSAALRTLGPHHPLLGSRIDAPTPTWLQTLRLTEHAYLADHKIKGAVVFPGTGFLEMALQSLSEKAAAGQEERDVLSLRDVEIDRALYLSEGAETRLETRRFGERWEVHAHTGDDGGWVRHAHGRCRREPLGLDAPSSPLDVAAVRVRCQDELPVDYAYRLFRDVGLDYGPRFQGINQLHYGPGEALAQLSLPGAPESTGTEESDPFLFHPALFDACLHTLFGALNLNGEDSDRRGNVYLPVSVRQVRLHRRPTARVWSHAVLRTRASQHFAADIRVYDEHCELVAEVLELRCQALEQPASVARQRQREWILEYEWVEAPTPQRDEPSAGVRWGGRWLVFAPHADHVLVHNLRQRGAECSVVVPGDAFSVDHDVYRVAPDRPQDFEQLLAHVGHRYDAPSAGGQNAPVQAIVHAWCLGDQEGEPGANDADQILGAGSLLHLAQALARHPASVPMAPAALGGTDPAGRARLWVVTDQVAAVTAEDPIRLAHGSVWGLRRVLANEHPNFGARIIDIDRNKASWSALAHELAQTPPDDELALRAGVRFVHRLRRHDLALEAIGETAAPEPSSTRRELGVRKSGDLKSLHWTALPELDLREHEVEIEVRAAALNFKDVMKALGLFPVRLLEGNLWSKDTLGMECSGRVKRVGARVTHVAVGDDVLALAPRSFASHVVTHGELVVSNPGLEPAAAAAIPVAFLTASAALEHLARLQPGERVLIHAATGGVGLAAIQIARDCGAEIFATAGSEEKRALLRACGVVHVFNSRSLRFADEIRAVTQGEGVDVVLNSLAGDAIPQSLAVLRDYGRFVEIGKIDLDRDLPLGLQPFTRCLSFHALDLDRMLAQRVELCGRLLRGIQARLQSGRLQALPVSVYGCADVGDAFRHMASAQHTGKLVVNLASEAVVQQAPGTTFRPDASYLITGGLGGFGLQLALWMGAHGAKHQILVGRRGVETPGAAAAVAKLEALGVSVQIEACDVSNASALERVLEKIPADTPLAGVFHAAAVLDDALITKLDLERYRRTFAAKAAGAWNLHLQTLSCALDHFVCFSSMASVLGNQGSGNYCAANAFVDTLAHYRKRRGLAALTVNWGVIADVGMAADEDFYRQNLERNGLFTIHSQHCLELLGLLLQAGRTQSTVCPIDFAQWIRLNPAGGEARLAELLGEAKGQSASTRTQAEEEIGLRAALAGLDAAARTLFVEQTIRKTLARVFRTEVEKIDSKRTLTALGADSLMAIELKNRLDALGLGISVTQLLNRSSVTTLAQALLESLGHTTAAPEAVESAAEPSASAGTWLVRQTVRDDAKLRLICFPYAGGGPGVYHRWQAELPDWVEVVAVSLPGRGTRTDEGVLSGIAEAAEQIVPELIPLLDRPFAMFGHCMGAILMYEVAQRLALQSHEAAHIFASGCMAPHLYNSPLVHEQDDGRFLDVLRLISFSGTRALIEDAELRRGLFPVLRGDFRSVAEYGDRFEARPPLGSPITGLAAEHDLFAAPKAMEAWARYTSRGYDLVRLPGDHYFVESDRETVTGIVRARLLAVLDGAASTPAHVIAHEGRRFEDCSLGDLPRPATRRTARLKGTGNGPIRVFGFPPACMSAEECPPAVNGDERMRYERVEWRGPTHVHSGCMDEMLETAYQIVTKKPLGRAIFYGHCLGAIVAYELVRRFEREGRPLPEHLVVAGTVGPHLYVAPDAHKLATPKLLELLRVLSYPGIDRLQQDSAFQEARLPQIRADLQAMATYQYRAGDACNVPITAISLRHDLWSYPLRTDTWRHHTIRRFDLEKWDGDHFECVRQPERISALVRSLSPADRPLAQASHLPGE